MDFIHAKRKACDWSRFDEDESRMIHVACGGTIPVFPMNLLPYGASAAEQRDCAKRWSASIAVPETQRLPARIVEKRIVA